MKTFSEISREELLGIRYVLTDIDDTITTDGLLPSTSLDGMEKLGELGIHVIPVTGRPAGWCDHIARMWPVAAVVGENGAFYFSYDRTQNQMRRWYMKPPEERRADMTKLESLAEKVLREVPGAALANDQAYRVSDLAIDFSEDVAPLSKEAVERIVAIFEAAGATSKVSSIHVNSWFGKYDKLTTSRICLHDLYQFDMEAQNESVAYLGDSPNDEPMFAYFKNSIGVANVRNFDLQHKPTWVTKGMNAAGFAEAAQAIVKAHAHSS